MTLTAADDWAFIVGIDSYPGLGDLGGAVRDAELFAAWLRDPGQGAVPPNHISTVLSSDYAPADSAVFAKPSVDDGTIPLSLLVTDAEEAKKARFGRRLYLYFAGHGISPRFSDTALLAANARKKETGHHWAGTRFADWFSASGFFEEVVLVMDCCRGSHEESPPRDPPFDPRKGREAKRWLHAFATGWGRAAVDEQLTTEFEGTFTSALVTGLRGPAADATGKITGSSLDAYVRDLMGLGPDDDDGPRFRKDGHGDVVFRTNVTWVATVRFDLTNGRGEPRLQDAGLAEVQPSHRSASHVAWTVGVGHYVLVHDKGEQPINLDGTMDLIDV